MNWLLDKLRRVLWTSSYSVVCLVAVTAVALYFKQDALLYFPAVQNLPLRPKDNPRGYRNPGEYGIPYEAVDIVCRGALYAFALRHLA